MTIKGRMVVGFGGVLALLVVLGAVAVWSILALKTRITVDVAEHVRMQDLADGASVLVMQHRRFEKDLLLNMGNPSKQRDYLEKFDQEAERLREHFAELKGLLVDEHAPIAADLVAAVEAYGNYNRGFQAIAKDAIGGAIPTAGDGNKRMAPLKDEIHAVESHVEAIAAQVKAVMVGTLKEAGALAASRSAIIGVVFLLIVIGALLAAVSTIMVIARGVHAIKAGIVPIAKGDLTRRVSYAGKDELGDIAQSINGLASAMQSGLVEISRTVGETDRAAQDLTATATRIATNTEETTAQASQVASSAVQTSGSTNAIADSARQMSNNMTNVAVKVEQMSFAISEVSRNCEAESQIAAEAESGARDARERMERLGQAAKEIGKVVEVITRIAAQTNLLALNATIEAASAGAAGKGFAVVANEVKDLARQTTGATGEIRAKIEEMQASTDEALNGMKTIGNVISKLHENSQAIVSAIGVQNTAMGEIAQNVATATQAANEIAGQVDDASKGVLEISHTIESLGDATRDSAQGVAQVKSSAEDLNRMSSALGDLVARFSLG